MINYRQKAIESSQKVCLLFLTLIIIFFGYPLGILILVPVLSYRSIIAYFLPKLDPRFGSVLKGLAAIFSAHTPYTNPISILLPFFYLNNSLDKHQLIKLFDERIMNLENQNGDPTYIQLKQRIVRKFGYNFWFNVTNFNLCEHIKYLDELCQERLVKDSEMLELTLQLSKLPFHSERSPWEIILVPRFQHETDPQIKSAIIFRFHHCLADGFSLLQILLRLGERPMLLQPKESQARPSQTFMNKFILGVYNLRFLIEGPYEAFKLFLLSNDNNQWLTKVAENYTGTFSAQQHDFPLSTLKNISTKRQLSVGTTLITMLMQATARAMKRRNVVGNKVKLYVTFPSPLPNRPDGVCNHFVFAKMAVDVDVNDVMATVQSVKLEYGRLQQSITFPLLTFISNRLANLPVGWIPEPGDVGQSTCLFSNFPGPTQPIDIAGCGVGEMYAIASPTKGCVIASLALSYNGKLRFVFGGHQINISSEDADFLKKEIVSVFNELS